MVHVMWPAPPRGNSNTLASALGTVVAMCSVACIGATASDSLPRGGLIDGIADDQRTALQSGTQSVSFATDLRG